MKHISQGTYFESCILAFFFPRKLQWWHPFTKSLSAWFKLISSTKTAIIVLFGCCLYPLCVCILLVFISNLLGAIQWHRIMTFPAPNYKQMISNKQNYRASDTSQPTLEQNQTVACQIIRTLSFLHDPSEEASILARAHSIHIPLRMVGLFPSLVAFFPPHMALVLKHLSGGYPLFSYFIGNNELWG